MYDINKVPILKHILGENFKFQKVRGNNRNKL